MRSFSLVSPSYIQLLFVRQCEYAVLHAYHSSEHLNTHRKEHFHKCEQCDLAFLIQEILGRICKRTDKCNHCKYAQYQTGNLRTQMKMHSGEKLNQCNQCDYVYSDPSTLRTHLKRREKSSKCNQCDFASSRAGDLRRHLKTHSGEKSNKCNQCDFATSLASNLTRHKKRHDSGEGMTSQDKSDWFGQICPDILSVCDYLSAGLMIFINNALEI